jgi:hypothetical protein
MLALKDGFPRRPSNLTVSSGSINLQSPEPSPTRSRYTMDTSISSSSHVTLTPERFVYVGPERKRFHANRGQAPYPLPCGLEELSRYFVNYC